MFEKKNKIKINNIQSKKKLITGFGVGDGVGFGVGFGVLKENKFNY